MSLYGRKGNFETLIQYIQDEIVEKKEVHYLADINKYYESLLQELLRNSESQYNATKNYKPFPRENKNSERKKYTWQYNLFKSLFTRRSFSSYRQKEQNLKCVKLF